MNHPFFFSTKTRHAADMLKMNGQTFKDESTSKIFLITQMINPDVLLREISL